jgi:hypothetical protein
MDYFKFIFSITTLTIAAALVFIGKWWIAGTILGIGLLFKLVCKEEELC